MWPNLCETWWSYSQLRVLRASGLSLERHLPNSLHAIELVGNGQWLSAMNLDRVSGCSQLQSLRLSGWDLRLSQFDMVAKVCPSPHEASSTGKQCRTCITAVV